MDSAVRCGACRSTAQPENAPSDWHPTWWGNFQSCDSRKSEHHPRTSSPPMRPPVGKPPYFSGLGQVSCEPSWGQRVTVLLNASLLTDRQGIEGLSDTSTSEARRDSLGCLCRTDDGVHFKVDDVAPGGYPLIDEHRRIRFHELETPLECRVHPAGDVRKTHWRKLARRSATSACAAT